MQKLLTLGTVLSLALIFLAGCAREKPRYVIGVSQCSEDIWREKQNAELRMGAYLQDNVELRFAAAYDSDQRQIEQIDSLVNMETPQQAQPQPLPVSEGSEYSQDEVPVFITRFKEAVEARLRDDSEH